MLSVPLGDGLFASVMRISGVVVLLSQSIGCLAYHSVESLRILLASREL